MPPTRGSPAMRGDVPRLWLRRLTSARARDVAALVAFLAVVTLVYVWIVSAGRWTPLTRWSTYYDNQAEGFRSGHLYVAMEPPARLKTLANPWDPANMAHWRWDYTYYKGHLHLYWGLVPALMVAAWKAVLRVRQPVGDEALVLLFALGRAVAGTLLIRGLARQVTPRPPAWAVWLAAAVFAFASPTVYTIARPAIYEAAIMGGACFLVTGLYLAFRGIFAVTARAAQGWLVAASVSLGLAAGSRVSLLPAVSLLIALTAFTRWRAERGGPGRLVTIGAAAGAPAAALMLGHFVLNYLRYDRFLEFGTRYHLTWPPLRMGLRFFAANLYLYLFRHAIRSCVFPFLHTKWFETRAVTPGWIRLDPEYSAREPSIGVMVAAPFAWLALGLLIAWLLRRRRARQVPALPPALPDASPDEAARWRWRWVWGALAVATIVTAAPVMLMWLSTMRYQADFTPGMMLIATLGGWQLLGAARGRAGRAAAAAAYVLLAVATVVVGLLLGFEGYFDQFLRYNPRLWQWLLDHASICGGRR